MSQKVAAIFKLSESKNLSLFYMSQKVAAIFNLSESKSLSHFYSI